METEFEDYISVFLVDEVVRHFHMTKDLAFTAQKNEVVRIDGKDYQIVEVVELFTTVLLQNGETVEEPKNLFRVKVIPTGGVK